MLKYDKNNSRHRIQFTLFGFALALLAILIAINLSSIGDFFSAVMSIISPIVIGAAIAYVLNPLLKLFEYKIFKKVRSKGFVRVISLILTYVVAILLLIVSVAIVLPRVVFSVVDIAKNYDSYLNTATGFVNAAIAKFSSNSEYYNPEQMAQLIKDIFTESGDIFQTIAQYVISYASGLITALKNVFLGLFISIYVLISKERLSAQASKVARAFLTDRMYSTALRYLRKTNSTFGKFFVGKLFDSTIVAFITLLLLLAFKMPYCILIAIIIGILNIIPFFGMVIGIIASSFIVLIATPDRVLLFILLMFIVYQIDVNIIAPKILGRSAGISSLGVIVAVIVMGAYFGIVGMIVAVPVFAVIISVVKELVEKRLKDKNLPVETTEYYEDSDYTHESEEHKTVTQVIVDTTVHLAEAAVSGIKHTISKEETEQTHTDDSLEEQKEDPSYPSSQDK